jgi:hypothetical protein
MELQWRDNQTWTRFGASHIEPSAPTIASRMVRVRVVASTFMVDGRPAIVGETVSIPADDLHHLLQAGKVVQV